VLRQTARRTRGDELVATAELVFVCIDRAGRPVPVPEEIGRSLAGATESTERLMVNGVSLAVEVHGDGPAILFIHGFPLDRTLWRDQLGGLTGWRRIAPDLRGMGRSDAPDLGYSMATYASDLAALLDALDVDRVVLCGLSMGGYVAFEFLRRWPRRVAGLILMDTRAEADSPEGKRGREQMIAMTREQGAGVVANAMLPRLLAADTPPESPVRAHVRKMVEGTPVAGLVGALGAIRDRPDSTALLAALRGLPTLALVGAEDVITPPDVVRAMAERIPGAEFEIVAGAGHLPPVEQPAATTDRLRRFLEPLLQT
jgi:pimeloyl-ACP methyl ester carboxylesterase